MKNNLKKSELVAITTDLRTRKKNRKKKNRKIGLAYSTIEQNINLRLNFVQKIRKKKKIDFRVVRKNELGKKKVCLLFLFEKKCFCSV